MQGYNCIMVYDQSGKNILFCKRRKNPYLGLFNLVGGKIETGENGFDAAYRELEEETSISGKDIELHHMMDFQYYNQNCYVEVYAGQLKKQEIELKEEIHPLYWLDANQNFFDYTKFAGEGNIGHMVEIVKQFGLGASDSRIMDPNTTKVENIPMSSNHNEKPQINTEQKYIGVDGCKGGWIAAILHHGRLEIGKYHSIEDIVLDHPDFSEFLIDMVIGLPSAIGQIRPDQEARKIIHERSSTIFPAPCRQAVYAQTTQAAYDENFKIMGKRFTPLSLGIFPKIKELDMFLQNNPEYKNRIQESHPEVCFNRLNDNQTVLTKKNEIDGIEERCAILSNYVEALEIPKLSFAAKQYKSNVDDIVDAICLAVTAGFVSQDMYDKLPATPMSDNTGLLMQMLIPKL